MQNLYDKTEYTELPTRSNEIQQSLPKETTPQNQESKEVVNNLTDKLKEVAQLTKESMSARNKASNALAMEHWNRAKGAYERRSRPKKKSSKAKRPASVSPRTASHSEASDEDREHIYLNGRKYSLVPVQRTRSISKSSTTSGSTSQTSSTSSSEGDYEDENAKIREREQKMEKHRERYANASEESVKAANRLKNAWLEVGQDIISSILVHTGERAEHLTDETLQAIKAKHRENKEKFLIKKHEKAKGYYESKKEKKHRAKHRREKEGKPIKGQKKQDRTPSQFEPAIKHHRQQREQATEEANRKRDLALRKLKEAALEIWASVREASKETLHEIAHQTAEGLKAKTKELEEQSKRIAAEKGRKLAEQQRGKLAKENPAKIQHLRDSNEKRAFISQDNSPTQGNSINEPSSQNEGNYQPSSQQMSSPISNQQSSQNVSSPTGYQKVSQNLSSPAGYQPGFQVVNDQQNPQNGNDQAISPKASDQQDSQTFTGATGYQPSSPTAGYQHIPQTLGISTGYQPSSQNVSDQPTSQTLPGYQMNATEPTHQVKPVEQQPLREERPSKLDQVKHKIKDTLGGKSNQDWEEAARREDQRRLHEDRRSNVPVW